jgi:hypothetical protein
MSAPKSELYGLTFFWHYARARVFAAEGDTSGAEAERDAMQQLFVKLPIGRAVGRY